MKKIKNVELHLENMQVITFDYRHVEQVELIGVTTSFAKFDRFYNDLKEYNTVNKISLVINSYANVMENHDINFIGSKQLPFDRILKCGDICQIVFKYEDNSIKEFGVRWYGESDYHNEAQTSHIDEDGYLCVLVDDSENSKEYFNEEDF